MVQPMRTNLSLTLLISLVLACSKPSEPLISTVESQYLAVLQLDQSKLLVSEIANNLLEPWHIAWGPDDHIWLTQHQGLVSRLDLDTKERKILLEIPDVHYQKSRGLLSMVIHPDFSQQPYVYLHYTYQLSQDEIRSRLVRYRFVSDPDTLVNQEVLLDAIPGTTYHNGSRMLITPDHKIILSTGDAGDKPGCLDASKLSGKMLRLNLDGSIPEDNPIAGSYVYSLGHRNAQGLAWAHGRIYSSEHGPHNDDEVNIIVAGGNYGWPQVEGYCDSPYEQDYCLENGVVEPLITWSPTIAPAGIEYYPHEAIPEWRNSLLLTSLKGRTLRVLKLDERGETIIDEQLFLQRVFGRFRDICVSPNGEIYLITSNTDWHPKRMAWMYDKVPLEGDDRIIKLSPLNGDFQNTKNLLVLTQDSVQLPLFPENFKLQADIEHPGAQLYMQHCAACHLPNGKGVAGTIPPLLNSEWVTGNQKRLITATLKGISGEIEVNGLKYNQEMPGFSASLSNQEIAEVLTFIREYFGGLHDQISTDDVAELRDI